MSRPLRNTDPAKFRLLTLRTENAQLLLRPDPETNEIVGGIIAKYQDELKIEIYSYSFLSNHYHLLVKAPLGNSWRFAQAINREIARRVNRLRNRSGHFWGRRYDEQFALEDADALEAMIYIIANPTNHGLVEHPKLWPGLSSYNQTLDGKDRQFTFTNYTAYRKAKLSALAMGKRVCLSDFKTTHKLKLSYLPQFVESSQVERGTLISKLIEQRVEKIKTERKSVGQGFMGRYKVLSQNPFSVPIITKCSPRPICYTKSFEAKKCFLAEYFPWLEWYRSSSRLFRSGLFRVTFPPFSIRPPLLYMLTEISS